MKERSRFGRQVALIAAAIATIGLGGCSDDTADRSVLLEDDVMLSVHDNCVEIDGPSVKGSSCGDPLHVSVLIVGQDDDKWVYGLAPKATERIVFGDEVEDRFVELEGFQAFAIANEENVQLVAENADGDVLHEFRVPIS